MYARTCQAVRVTAHRVSRSWNHADGVGRELERVDREGLHRALCRAGVAGGFVVARQGGVLEERGEVGGAEHQRAHPLRRVRQREQAQRDQQHGHGAGAQHGGQRGHLQRDVGCHGYVEERRAGDVDAHHQAQVAQVAQGEGVNPPLFVVVGRGCLRGRV